MDKHQPLIFYACVDCSLEIRLALYLSTCLSLSLPVCLSLSLRIHLPLISIYLQVTCWVLFGGTGLSIYLSLLRSF